MVQNVFNLLRCLLYVIVHWLSPIYIVKTCSSLLFFCCPFLWLILPSVHISVVIVGVVNDQALPRPLPFDQCLCHVTLPSFELCFRYRLIYDSIFHLSCDSSAFCTCLSLVIPGDWLVFPLYLLCLYITISFVHSSIFSSVCFVISYFWASNACPPAVPVSFFVDFVEKKILRRTPHLVFFLCLATTWLKCCTLGEVCIPSHGQGCTQSVDTCHLWLTCSIIFFCVVLKICRWYDPPKNISVIFTEIVAYLLHEQPTQAEVNCPLRQDVPVNCSVCWMFMIFLVNDAYFYYY